MIPNSNIILASNMTRDWSHVNLNMAVGYGENLEKVFGIINEVCRQLRDDRYRQQDNRRHPAGAERGGSIVNISGWVMGDDARRRHPGRG